MEYDGRHATCCCGEPAHAQAGDEWVCTLTLTHLRSPPSSRVACHDRTPPAVAATGESGRWLGPLLTVLDACECHSRPEGNTERIPNTPHPHFEGRRCISKPASSQPGESGRQDSPRRNPRALARGGGQRSRDLLRLMNSPPQAPQSRVSGSDTRSPQSVHSYTSDLECSVLGRIFRYPSYNVHNTCPKGHYMIS